MTEPLSLKIIGDAITSFWGRSAILLWCLATLSLLSLIALAVGAHFQFGDAPALYAAHGTILALAALALFVFAAFKTYSERPQPILSLIPNEQQSFWGQSLQQNGQTTTSFCLRFQATNLSNGKIMLSALKLCRPFVRRRHILAKHLLVKHPHHNTYSFTNPIDPHSLTYASGDIIVDHPVGRAGQPMRVTIQVQDHVGRWHKLFFPHVPSIETGVKRSLLYNAQGEPFAQN
jgi:hypothetical protein